MWSSRLFNEKLLSELKLNQINENYILAAETQNTPKIFCAIISGKDDLNSSKVFFVKLKVFQIPIRINK
jgi:hypothetical protein